MIPKTDGDAAPLGQRPLSVLPVVTVFGHLLAWRSLRGGLSLGFLIRFSVLVVVVGRLRIEEVLSAVVDSDVHHCVADVVKSFDTVDRGVLDLVLSSSGLPGWFRHAYFEFHSHVRLRFKLATGLETEARTNARYRNAMG